MRRCGVPFYGTWFEHLEPLIAPTASNCANDEMTAAQTPPLDWHAGRIAERRRRFLSPALGTFTAYDKPQAWRSGSGQYLFDLDGRRYLDCMAQNVCISVGYRHPGVDAAVRAQLDEVQHVTTVYDHPQPGHFAEELVARLPAGHDWVVHFVNSGAEAIDLAVLVARLHSRNFEVLTLRDAYHGMQFTAMAATGIGHARQPLPPAPGFVNVIAPHSYRGPFGADAAPYLAELSRAIGSATSGALAAMIVEPIQGYGGIVEMPEGYLAGAAAQAARRRRPADRRRGADRLRPHRLAPVGLRGPRHRPRRDRDVEGHRQRPSDRRDGDAPRDRGGHVRADVLQHLRLEPGHVRRRPGRAAGDRR